MNALIIHGIMGRAGENWGQWLHDKLVDRSYNVMMPNLPNSDHPDRQEWFLEISRYMESFGSDTVIIAHSLGVTSALDYLDQATTPLKGLISVSGFADDYGFELNSYFLQGKTVNFDKVNHNIDKAFVFYGDNDPYVPQSSLKELANNLNVQPSIIPNGGHLNAAAGFNKFPQLLQATLSV